MQCFNAELHEKSGVDEEQTKVLECGVRWAVEATRNGRDEEQKLRRQEEQEQRPDPRRSVSSLTHNPPLLILPAVICLSSCQNCSCTSACLFALLPMLSHRHWLKCLEKETSSDRRETGKFSDAFPTFPQK